MWFPICMHFFCWTQKIYFDKCWYPNSSEANFHCIKKITYFALHRGIKDTVNNEIIFILRWSIPWKKLNTFNTYKDAPDWPARDRTIFHMTGPDRWPADHSHVLPIPSRSFCCQICSNLNGIQCKRRLIMYLCRARWGLHSLSECVWERPHTQRNSQKCVDAYCGRKKKKRDLQNML